MESYVKALSEKSMVLKLFFWDATGLVKIFINDEQNSSKAKALFSPFNCHFTTDLVMLESLQVFKRKWLKKEIDDSQYNRLCYVLNRYAGSRIRRCKTDYYSHETQYQIRKLRAEYPKLDQSDAFQLVAIDKELSHYVGASAPNLVTSDNDLAFAAITEGIQVINLNSQN